MRRFIIILLVLFVAVWIGVKIAADPGYVLLAYQQWTLEMSLWVAIVIVLLVFSLLYFLLRFIRNIGILPQRLRNWSAQRHDRAAMHLTNEGLLALAAGEWRIAEKKLLKADMHGDLRWLNYMAAARAAHEQGAFDRRDGYLQRTLKIAPKTEVVVGLGQASFQLTQRQFEQAQATLRRLLQLAPRQKYIVELLAKVYVELKAWDELIDLLVQAQKQKSLTTDKITALQLQAYQALLLKTAQQTPHVQILQSVWQRVPHQLQQNPILLREYVRALHTQNANSEAEELIRKSVQKNWDSGLVAEYGLSVGAHPDKQLTIAEGWLKTHANDPILLLTLGRLCIQNQLWGKARSYLETSLAQKPAPETFIELAKLFEKLNEHQLAFENYKKGLLLVSMS